MSRPVDRQKYEAKRAVIVSAAARQFANQGYERTTTAAVCAEAGISSGTFFHYFPSKLEVLVAVLESGCDDLRERLEVIERDASGLDAIMAYAAASETELSDASFGVFVSGLAGVEAQPGVAAALATEVKQVTAFLSRQVDAGRIGGEIRRDIPGSDLVRWVSWIIDGAAQAAAAGRPPGAGQLRGGVRAVLTL